MPNPSINGDEENILLGGMTDPIIAATPQGRLLYNKAFLELGDIVPCVVNGSLCAGDECILSGSECLLRWNGFPASYLDIFFTHPQNSRRFRVVTRHVDGYSVIHFKPVLNDSQIRKDVLTGLPHMEVLADALTWQIVNAQRHGGQVGVFFIDILRFGVINTTLGREKGDEILKIISNRLKRMLRGTDMVARQGADVFVVIASPGDSGLRGLVTLGQKLIKNVIEPIPVGGTTISAACCVGISVFPANGDNFLELLKTADIALHNAKKTGRNELRFYSAEMDRTAVESLELEHRLQSALRENEFLLHYQPQVDMNGSIIGTEALLRWNMPGKGLIPPLKFIPLAEQSGFIIEIGHWVINEACRQIGCWLNKEHLEMCVAVNCSTKQFRDVDLIPTISEALRRHSVPPRLLCIEITENAAMEEPARAIKTMRQIADMGVVLAIDDFGTGYSSLNYLKQFPVDKLKIDKSFVGNITADKADANIVTSIINLAHTFGLKVVAEGAEKVEQIDFLRKLECDEIQGYFISKPLPAADFIKLALSSRLFVL
ncbi:MAG TPA: bifunctional diguanylate cyclase/phosphodiesterase [Dissulfurispiraceae bacterium]|nr:bifunctional diguanylate cyclase/phosphodiesterase [Dissulfurispiraceae bacterium]